MTVSHALPRGRRPRPAGDEEEGADMRRVEGEIESRGVPVPLGKFPVFTRMSR